MGKEERDQRQAERQGERDAKQAERKDEREVRREERDLGERLGDLGDRLPGVPDEVPAGMIELAWVDKATAKEKTSALAMDQSAFAHFRTPDLLYGGNNGWVSCSSDLNLSADVELSLSRNADGSDPLKMVICPPSLSASIKFGQASHEVELRSNEDYYVQVKAKGDVPNGVTLELSSRDQP